jgi:hypothetical protein
MCWEILEKYGVLCANNINISSPLPRKKHMPPQRPKTPSRPPVAAVCFGDCTSDVSPVTTDSNSTTLRMQCRNTLQALVKHQMMEIHELKKILLQKIEDGNMTIMDTGRAKIGTNYSYYVQGDEESNDTTVTATTKDTATSTAPTENTGVPVATPPAGTANTGVQIYAPTLAYYKNNSEKLKKHQSTKKENTIH